MLRGLDSTLKMTDEERKQAIDNTARFVTRGIDDNLARWDKSIDGTVTYVSRRPVDLQVWWHTHCWT